MSGTAVIVIVVLALVVLVGGSILVFGLTRREPHTPSNAQEVDNGGKLPTASNQQSDHPGD